MTCFTSLKRTIIFKIQPARFNGLGGLPPQNPSELPSAAGPGPPSLPRRILNCSKPRRQLWVVLKAFISESPFPGEGGFSGSEAQAALQRVRQGSECPSLGQTTNNSETKHNCPVMKTLLTALQSKPHLCAARGHALVRGAAGTSAPSSEAKPGLFAGCPTA